MSSIDDLTLIFTAKSRNQTHCFGMKRATHILAHAQYRASRFLKVKKLYEDMIFGSNTKTNSINTFFKICSRFFVNLP
jgi:hypothetical protein